MHGVYNLGNNVINVLPPKYLNTWALPPFVVVVLVFLSLSVESHYYYVTALPPATHHVFLLFNSGSFSFGEVHNKFISTLNSTA